MKNKASLAVLLFFILIVSVYLGTTVAEGDVAALSGWAGVSLLIFFLIRGYQFSWQVMLFLAWGNISFMLNFRIEPIHAVTVIFGLFVLSSWMRGVRLPLDVSLRRAGIVPLNVMILVFLVYGCIHLFISRSFPVIPGEFDMGNSAKAYFVVFAPLAILLFGLNTRIGFQVRKGWTATFLILMAFAVVGNVAYLGYLYFNGFSAADTQAGDEPIAMIYIPIINAVPHHFAMRTLGPLAVLFGFGMASTPGWWSQQSVFLKLTVLVLIGGGLAGSVMSGGRAAVAVCLFFGGVIALHRKQVAIIVLAAMGGTAVLIIANLFSGVINEKAPMFVARPLQYFMLEKGDAMETIDNSQDQRDAIWEAAIDEWLSDSRITLIGRGVYSYRYTAEDLRPVLGEQGAFVEVNLRAGTCHALIPSALIQYGLIGFIIYLAVWFFLLRFNWKLYRLTQRENLSPQLQTMVICLFFYLGLRLVMDLVAAGWMTIFVITMFILIRSRISFELAQRVAEEESEKEVARATQEGSRTNAPVPHRSFATR